MTILIHFHQSHFGERYEGVLGSDFYAAYNVHQGLHQRCWVHFLRDAHELKEKYPHDEALLAWATSVKAIAELKAAGVLPQQVELRPVKYLNNLIEQDHRLTKRLVKPGMGFFSFETAWRTLQGYEVMNMLRKGQVQGVNRGDSLSQAAFTAELFDVAI